MSTIEKALGKKKQADSQPEVTDSPVVGAEPVTETSAAQVTPQRETNAQASEYDAIRHLDIDLKRLDELGMVIETGDRRKVNDEYRAIKRKLLNNAFGPAAESHDKGNLMMVTSARPNEGKTFNAINLAISMAVEKDRTVLLIDADVLKPSICRDLNVEAKQGLVEYLLGEVSDISEIIYSTNIPALKIIPAGMPHYQSAELLSSDRMASLVDELARRYDDRVVLFDAPPLLGVNETVILANLMGQAIIVAEEDKSKIADLQEAVKYLDEDIAAGVILNKSKHASDAGYGYGYGYGHYGAAEDKS